MEDLIEMVRKDEQAKAKAKMNRISSELRTYYEDFMSVKDEKFTDEMVEVLKDNVADMFKILKENGVEF